MSGTTSGGYKARDKNYQNYGLDFFAVIGSFGGRKSRGGGFTHNSALASRAGKIGGSRPRKPTLTPLAALNRQAEKERRERDAYFKRRLQQIKKTTADRRAQLVEQSEMSQNSILSRFAVRRPW